MLPASSPVIYVRLVEAKTVQGILRHAKIQTTLDLYAGRQ